MVKKYKNTYSYIAEKIEIGDILEHTSGIKYKVFKKPYLRDCEIGFVLECRKMYDNSNVILSLKIIYEKCLIKQDSQNLFEMVDDKEDIMALIENVDGKEEDTNKMIENDVNGLILTYNDLYNKMEKACVKELIYPYYTSFWHLTAISNLVSIINDGCMLARGFNNHIVKDLYNLNSTSTSVMSTDICPKRLRQYVRLYFNPNNPAAYNMLQNSKEPVALIEVFKNVIESKNEHILFSYGSAHFMEYSDFDWFKYDVTNLKNLSNYNVIDYDKIYTRNYADNFKIKNIVNSEVLIYKKLDNKWIKSFKFRNEIERDIFLDSLSPSVRKEIKNKCYIDNDAFYGRKEVTVDDLFK